MPVIERQERFPEDHDDESVGVRDEGNRGEAATNGEDDAFCMHDHPIVRRIASFAKERRDREKER